VVAARLLGAATAALERVGNSLEPADERAYQRTVGLTRDALQDVFDVEFAAGRELSPADAFALSSRPPASESKCGDLSPLSAREREVVRLIARGCTSEAIAEALVISRRTADTHAAHIREKLGLRSRAEIAAWAIRNGFD
jgi:non-specific serine/threonine protein kinase